MIDRDRSTHEALLRVDGELAGLFRLGLELSERLDEPGVPYLVAHCGRELGKAVVAAVAAELPLSSVGSEEGGRDATPTINLAALAQVLGVPEDDIRLEDVVARFGDNHRRRIARALGLRGDHPLVGRWVKMQRVLVRTVHYRYGGRPPSADEVRDAFRLLASVLFARIGPYFETQEALRDFLAVSVPTADLLERLQVMLVRPQLRVRLFGDLAHAEWLKPLREIGVFDFPPEWVPHPDGGFTAVAWPEGQCLVRFARQEPVLVAELMDRVPDELQNPSVWRLVADAIRELPLRQANALAPKLARALERPHSPVLGYAAVRAAERLASERSRTVYPLVQAFVRLSPLPENPEPSSTRWARCRPRELLRTTSDFVVAEVVEDILPLLPAIDPILCWEWAVGQLRRSRELLAAAGCDDDDQSQHWCPSFDRASRDADFRAHLAVIAIEAGRRMLQSSSGELGRLLRALPPDATGLFARMRLVLLMAGIPDTRPLIGDYFRRADALDPVFGAREVSALLRAHFADADPTAQAAVVRAIELGPDAADIDAITEWRGEEPDDPAARERVADDWRRRRLRWFHDRLPPVLASMAERLEVVPTVPSHRDRALDEVGVYSSGVYSAGETSPVTAEALRAMSNAAVRTLLTTWSPAAETFEGPSRRGLAEVLSEDLAANLEERAALIDQLVGDPETPAAYLRACIRALNKVSEGQGDIPSGPTLAAAGRFLSVDLEVIEPLAQDEWRWGRSEAIDLVLRRFGNRTLSIEESGAVAALVDNALVTSVTWSRPREDDERRLEAVLSSAFNEDAGKVTELALVIGDPQHQRNHRDPIQRLCRWLDIILGRADAGAVAARARLGCALPYLVHRVQAWVEMNADNLLAEGATSPVEHPAWAAYLRGAIVNKEALRFLRPWYQRQVAALDATVFHEEATSAVSRDERLSRRCLDHLGLAYLEGDLELNDTDHLLADAFAKVRAEDRSHFYWATFRRWSDADGPPEVTAIDRLMELWRWRLEVLETAGPGAATREEADGLGWIACTPGVPTGDALPLALRTTALEPALQRARGQMWPQIVGYAELDVGAAITMAENLVTGGLAAEWAEFAFDDVAPVLQRGLAASDPEVRRRARLLADRLMEQQSDEYGQLLRSTGTSDA